MFNFLISYLRPKGIFLIAGILCLIFLFISIKKLQHDNNRLKKENILLKEKINVCQKENERLAKELVLQDKKYKEKMNKLLKIANKPVKVIEIPKIITKRVYITPKECKQMAIMIDEFIDIKRRGNVRRGNDN